MKYKLHQVISQQRENRNNLFSNLVANLEAKQCLSHRQILSKVYSLFINIEISVDRLSVINSKVSGSYVNTDETIFLNPSILQVVLVTSFSLRQRKISK